MMIKLKSFAYYSFSILMWILVTLHWNLVTHSLTNLGVLFDTSLSLQQYTFITCGTAYLELRWTSTVCRFLTDDCTKKTLCLHWCSRLDNSLLSCLPLWINFKRFRTLQLGLFLEFQESCYSIHQFQSHVTPLTTFFSEYLFTSEYKISYVMLDLAHYYEHFW